jgi:hypothetical protein
MNSTDFYYYYDTKIRNDDVTVYCKIAVLSVIIYSLCRCIFRCRRHELSTSPDPQILCSLLPEKYTNTSEVDDLETCTICIDDFEEGDEVIKLVCKHSFHPKCIVPWLEKSAECPNCKAKIY